MEEKIERVVLAMEDDISGRYGLGNEWHNIDETVKQEIRDKWTEIVREEFEE